MSARHPGRGGAGNRQTDAGGGGARNPAPAPKQGGAAKGEGESAVFHGNQFDRSPHFTGAVAVDWWATEKLRLSAQLRHHSPYFSDPQNSPALRIDSGTNVDSRFEYEVGGLSIFGQVRNLFDTLNMLSVSSPITAEAEDPRTFSLGIEGRF